MRFAAIAARGGRSVSEVVLSIVTDAEAVRSVALGDDGIIAGPEAAAASMST